MEGGRERGREGGKEGGRKGGRAGGREGNYSTTKHLCQGTFRRVYLN
jgi:hypothetical protein